MKTIEVTEGITASTVKIVKYGLDYNGNVYKVYGKNTKTTEIWVEYIPETEEKAILIGHMRTQQTPEALMRWIRKRVNPCIHRRMIYGSAKGW